MNESNISDFYREMGISGQVYHFGQQIPVSYTHLIDVRLRILLGNAKEKRKTWQK